MRLTVKLHGSLRKYLPAGRTNPVVLDVGSSATVADVINCLGIPANHSRIAVVDEKQLEPTAVLSDGQELNLFPPLVGGV
ncbi:MAG: Mut7-C ubiquitin [Deltaproteobacteria bacterium]|nr:Mut7-C ubiquitin [Deltaproteobacteria bacterium]